MRKHQVEPIAPDSSPVDTPNGTGLQRTEQATELGDSIAAHLEGSCTFSDLKLDFSVHTNDTVERSTGHASFVVPPKLTVALMMEGDLDAAIDDHPLVMSARHGPAGYILMNTEPARLDRWIRSGQRVRKVIVSLPFADCMDIIDILSLRQQLNIPPPDSRITVLHWQPTAKALRHAEELMHSSSQNASLARLENSIAALALVRQALNQCHQAPVTDTSRLLNTRDAKRARQAREYILEHIDQPLTIQCVASHTGMSISTLQRIFKNGFGCTVMEFVRIRRLELARLALLDEGLTVGQAAFLAGYSNTANFSNAFQREFGYSPSSCIKA